MSAPVPFWVYLDWNWVELGWDWVWGNWGLRGWGLGLDNISFEQTLSMATVYWKFMGLLVFIFLATMYQRLMQGFSKPCLKL